MWGGVSGALFAAILIFMERRSTLQELSMSRTATWGALAALFLPFSITILDLTRSPISLSYDWNFTAIEFAVALGLGACCAVITLKVARRGAADTSRAAA